MHMHDMPPTEVRPAPPTGATHWCNPLVQPTGGGCFPHQRMPDAARGFPEPRPASSAHQPLGRHWAGHIGLVLDLGSREWLIRAFAAYSPQHSVSGRRLNALVSCAATAAIGDDWRSGRQRWGAQCIALCNALCVGTTSWHYMHMHMYMCMTCDMHAHVHAHAHVHVHVHVHVRVHVGTTCWHYALY